MQRDRVTGGRTLRQGRALVVGYCGEAGESADVARNLIESTYPDWTRADASAPARAGISAFVFFPPDDGSVVHAKSPDGSFIVLGGRVFAEQSANQVLEAWLSRGDASFSDLYFHGLVAAWNARTADFVLLRDQYGVETGYYTELGDGVLFADDQQALVSLGAEATPSPVAIDTFLASGYFPAPLSPYEAIAKIGPGKSVRLDGGGIVTRTYAGFEPSPLLSYHDALAQAPARLQTALERTWPQEGQAGLLLSGGVDSAMLAVGITEMLGESVTAFTFRYDEYEGKLNEGDAARLVADHLQIPHEEITISPGDLMADLDEAVAAYGEPLNWGLHSYKVGPIADKGIGTIFSGAGADGTGMAKRHRAALRFSRLPSALRRAIRAAVRSGRVLNLEIQPRAEWATRPTRSIGELFSPDGDHSRAQRTRLYTDPDLVNLGGDALLSICEGVAAELDHGDAERTLTIMDKLLTSAEAMLSWNRAWPRQHGLEARLPYYDPDLIDLGLHIEGKAFGKDLIRAVAGRSLPDEVAQAPKVAQQMPVSHWLRGPLYASARERLSDLPPAMAEVFDQAAILATLESHKTGSGDYGWVLVSLLTLSSWYAQQAR